MNKKEYEDSLMWTADFGRQEGRLKPEGARALLRIYEEELDAAAAALDELIEGKASREVSELPVISGE